MPKWKSSQNCSEVQDYKAGQAIIRPGFDQPDNLYILAHGEVQVNIQSTEGEAAIHVLKPVICWHHYVCGGYIRPYQRNP